MELEELKARAVMNEEAAQGEWCGRCLGKAGCRVEEDGRRRRNTSGGRPPPQWTGDVMKEGRHKQPKDHGSWQGA